MDLLTFLSGPAIYFFFRHFSDHIWFMRIKSILKKSTLCLHKQIWVNRADFTLPFTPLYKIYYN